MDTYSQDIGYWTNIVSNIKRRIFKTIIDSILTCAAEIRVNNKSNQSKIAATKIKYWRRYCRVMSVDRIKIYEIRRETRVEEDITNFIEEKRYRKKTR